MLRCDLMVRNTQGRSDHDAGDNVGGLLLCVWRMAE
jgi:hypothetical protein